MPQIVDQHRTQLSDAGNLAQGIHTTATLATNAHEYVLIETPGGSDVRITGARYEAFGGKAEVSLFIAPTMTDNGNAVTKSFYSLQNMAIPTLGLYAGGAASNEGTLGGSFNIFGTTAAAGAATSSVSQTAVRRLTADSQYLIKLKAIGNNVDIQLFLEWAEL